jgi:hypothetical protein
MKQFSTSIAILASPETVWALLTDADLYPSWNSTIEKIAGRIADGEKITVHAKTAPGRAFPLKVTRFQRPRHMTWSGGIPLGLFNAVRTFTLSSTQPGSVTFAMDETYDGLLARLVTRSIPDLQPAFETFAQDLKRRAESAPGDDGETKP